MIAFFIFDGFVKSPSAALRCILRHCGVPKKYASLLRICAPCRWSFLQIRPLSSLFTRLSYLARLTVCISTSAKIDFIVTAKTNKSITQMQKISKKILQQAQGVHINLHLHPFVALIAGKEMERPPDQAVERPRLTPFKQDVPPVFPPHLAEGRRHRPQDG